jgi:outer membrane immunogenic protein
MEDASMKRVLLASAGLAALMIFAGSAIAADMYAAPSPYAAPSLSYVVPNSTWNGFYVGANGGGAWGSSTWSGFSSFNTSGGLVGGTVGYNRQFGQIVGGVEGDLDWANIQGGGVCTFGCQTTNNWLGTVRGRLGYAGGTWMPYVTGGLAFGNFQAGNIFGTSNTTNAGWTLGAGVEYAFAGNWTVKAEYLYVDLGNFNCATCIVGTNVSSTMNIVRGGVNFHF